MTPCLVLSIWETIRIQSSRNVAKGFWLRLVENEGYERLNLATTYLAVFFAPVAAFFEILAVGETMQWSPEAARWVEALMGIFFMFDICVGALA